MASELLSNVTMPGPKRGISRPSSVDFVESKARPRYEIANILASVDPSNSGKALPEYRDREAYRRRFGDATPPSAPALFRHAPGSGPEAQPNPTKKFFVGLAEAFREGYRRWRQGPPGFLLMSAFFLVGDGNSGDGAGYSKTFKLPYRPAVNVPREFHFEGRAWAGTVERLERISELAEKLPRGRRYGGKGKFREQLTKLLINRDNYSPEIFRYILEALEQGLQSGIPHLSYQALYAEGRYRLEQDSGAKIEEEAWRETSREFAEHASHLSVPALEAVLGRQREWIEKWLEVRRQVSESSLKEPLKQDYYPDLQTLLLAARRSWQEGELDALGEALSQLRERHAAELEFQQKFHLPRSSRSRNVIWNPFAPEHQDNIVLHRSMGEGRVVEEMGDVVGVLFPGQRTPVKVSRHTLVRPADTEQWRAITLERMARYSHLPWYWAFACLRHVLDRKELEWISPQISGGRQVDLFGNDRAKPLGLFITEFKKVQTSLDDATRSGKAARLEELIRYLASLHGKIGLDPIAFVFRILVGERPGAFASPEGSFDYTFADRILTPDMVRGFLEHRPWLRVWREKGLAEPAGSLVALGHYFTGYFTGAARPKDLTDLYFNFRDGDPAAFAEVANLFREPVLRWAQDAARLGPVSLVPMIGTAPMEKLAGQYGLPVLFPWAERPLAYGEGVEGLRAYPKLKKVELALNLRPEQAAAIRGKSVLLLDDNLTDGVTYMIARKLLLDAGALEVGLITLTRTVRHPGELEP